MPSLVQRTLRLWNRPPVDQEVALAAFRELYSDPVAVNGTETPVRDLVERAASLHRAFENLSYEILEQTETTSHCSFAFRISGRHVGPLATPLGELQPTGRLLHVLAMDIFTIIDDRVAQIWTLADYPGLITEAGLATLVRSPGDAAASVDLTLPRGGP